MVTATDPPALDPIPKLDPISTDDSTIAPSAARSNPEEIPERVVSAPVIPPSEPTPAPEIPPATLTLAPDEPSQPPSTTKEPSAPNSRTATSPQTSPTSPKGDSKVKSWLKGKFSRRASKTPKTEARENEISKPFVGGAALTGPSVSNSSLDRRESSVRDVALAGRQGSGEDVQEPEGGLYSASEEGSNSKGMKRNSSPSISSLSSDGDDPRGRSDRRRSSSSHGDEFEEARDTFDEKLAPPPTFGSAGRASDSPVRDSKFLEDL